MSSSAEADIKMSFAVFESFATLAQQPVKLYRGLNVLKQAKSSFKPLFNDADNLEEIKQN